MRMINPENQLNIEFVENQIVIIVIENKKEYMKFTNDLWRQSRGDLGYIIFSEEEKVISMSKRVNMVINLFDISMSEKRIVNKLYQDMSNQVKEQFIERFLNICSLNMNLIDEVINTMPYNLDYKLETNPNDFFKFFDVHIRQIEDDLLSFLVDYMKVYSRLCGIDLFIFVGLKNYFSENELELLYNEAFNEKIAILDIEAYQNRLLKNEKMYIIDCDNCIIEAN